MNAHARVQSTRGPLYQHRQPEPYSHAAHAAAAAAACGMAGALSGCPPAGGSPSAQVDWALTPVAAAVPCRAVLPGCAQPRSPSPRCSRAAATTCATSASTRSPASCRSTPPMRRWAAASWPTAVWPCAGGCGPHHAHPRHLKPSLPHGAAACGHAGCGSMGQELSCNGQESCRGKPFRPSPASRCTDDQV